MNSHHCGSGGAGNRPMRRYRHANGIGGSHRCSSIRGSLHCVYLSSSSRRNFAYGNCGRHRAGYPASCSSRRLFAYRTGATDCSSSSRNGLLSWRGYSLSGSKFNYRYSGRLALLSIRQSALKKWAGNAHRSCSMPSRSILT